MVKDDLLKVISELNQVDDSTLERKGKDFNFSDVRSEIAEIFENVRAINQNPALLDSLPKSNVNQISVILNSFKQVVQQISHFDAKQQNPQAVRNTISENIAKIHSALYLPFFVPIKLSGFENTLALGNLDQIRGTIASSMDEINNMKKQAQEIIKTMQGVSGSIGISKFARVFGAQAECHEKRAKVWLAISAVAAVLIGAFLWIIFNHMVDAIGKGADIKLTLQAFIVKILLLSFFSVVFYQIVKNYNANMHLSIQNKHRENCMVSFQSFVSSTDDQKIKDVVLIQATRAIFDSGETGYISKKEGNVGGIESIRIMDQIKE